MDFKSRYQYNIKTDLLGKGGFARVYRAFDVLLERQVAIKVFTTSDKDKYDLLDEMKKAIRLEHPALLRYFDVAVVEGMSSFGEKEVLQIGVMELANYGDLKTFTKGSFDYGILNKLLVEVLQGLSYLHSKGIIHRDLKAQNILLIEEEGLIKAKISDFGISKYLQGDGNQSSMAVGTIEYMAPEQFNPAKYGVKGKIGTNLDLWSFGVMLYELIMKKSLFGSRGKDTTSEQIMSTILSSPLPAEVDTIPEPYRSVVKRCLISEAEKRVKDAAELIPLLTQGGGTFQVQPPIAAFNSEMTDYDEETKFIDINALKEKATQRSTGSHSAIQSTGSLPTGNMYLDQADIPKKKKTKVILFSVIGVLMAAAAFFALTNMKKDGTKTDFIAPETTLVNGGQFIMGSSAEDADENEKPAHSVQLGGFEIGKYEVTIAQFKAFINETGYKTSAEEEGFSSVYSDTGWVKTDSVNWEFDLYGKKVINETEKFPVIHISWTDATKYCNWLSKKTGKRYRLPSEAEWEFASKSGGKDSAVLYSGDSSLDKVGWYDENSQKQIHPVGQKVPNKLGIYDMSGNVMEWVSDWFAEDYYKNTDSKSPTGPKTGDYKVMRGGSWSVSNYLCRTSSRLAYIPNGRGANIGFRVCKDITP